ncbi:MAG: DUF427 domain-containing protein [Myxococcales bacterium]|nr:DUF427 domain-containing protein [Myxococcales bacterium]
MPDLEAARAVWRYRGRARPDFAEAVGPGRESVWDYPRPPRIERDDRHVRVGTAANPLADTRRALRVLETASPPTFYIPAEDVSAEALVSVSGRSLCEWKGEARYFALSAESQPIAWSYPDPFTEFSAIRDCFGFYPGRVPCFVDGERVRAQPGGFYGGWMTNEICGPVKGLPGSEDW